MSWSSKIPKRDGWYWIRYKGKRSLLTCPCHVMHIGDAVSVHTARNDTFVAGPNHGGKRLNYDGKPVKCVEFWSERLEFPGTEQGSKLIVEYTLTGEVYCYIEGQRMYERNENVRGVNLRRRNPELLGLECQFRRGDYLVVGAGDLKKIGACHEQDQR